MCKELTPNQEAYARGVLFERKTKRQAYRDAYPSSVDSNDETIDSAIWRLEQNERFSLGFAKLQAEAEAVLNITRDDVLKELYRVGFCNDTEIIKTKDKLTALGMIIKMLGYEQAQKVDMTVSDAQVKIYLPAKDPEPE
jgi:hypothetical protein